MIGFYGATCNNMYMFAKDLAAQGREVCFVEDRAEGFPHSQPVWDDVDACFESEFDCLTIDWDEFEARQEWQTPSWYFKPETVSEGWKKIFYQSPTPFLLRLAGCRYLRASSHAYAVFDQLRECDFLVVCGVKASIMAMLTGRPYMIFPHGSDMRLAVGVESKNGLKGKLLEWLLVNSFLRASFVGSSLPDASAEVERRHFRRLKTLVIERVPLPYMVSSRLPDTERRNKLNELFFSLGRKLPAAEYYCFTPSRINFHWKGHDRLLRAIEKNRGVLNIHFIFLGWGDDYLKAVEYVEQQRLTDVVTVLPLFLSKKYLMRFFTSVDFIIDSLNGNGGYGTSLSEAMSVGCPVVTWISDMFDRPGWERPPVIHARTEEELGVVMKDISSGKIDLASQSRTAADWFARVHSSEKVFEVLQEKIQVRR